MPRTVPKMLAKAFEDKPNAQEPDSNNSVKKNLNRLRGMKPFLQKWEEARGDDAKRGRRNRKLTENSRRLGEEGSWRRGLRFFGTKKHLRREAGNGGHGVL